MPLRYGFENGWTGAVYSLWRVVLGLGLAVFFAWLLPWGGELYSNQGVIPEARLSPLARTIPNVLDAADSPPIVWSWLVLGLAGSLAFAAGFRDRVAAALVWYVLACLHGRNPLATTEGLPVAGWLLLAHAVAMPAAPYGSWDARGRLDPGGGWSFPPALFGVAWLVLAVLHLPPLAPLSFFPRARPWLWLVTLAWSVAYAHPLSPGVLMLHAFTFDPAWIRALAPAAAPSLILYDGNCGFCHGWVRFLIAEDPEGRRFRYAPLQGERAHAVLDEGQRAAVGDTVVVISPGGDVLSRSDAAIHIGGRLGGVWRAATAPLRLVPRPMRDATYDAVARVRHRLARRPKEACPILPKELRERFEG